MAAESDIEMKSADRLGIEHEVSSGDEDNGPNHLAKSDNNPESWIRCCFISALPFTFHFGIVNLVTSALGAYLTSQLTTIEKQFGLSSVESGVLASMNDAGFLITVLFATYLGRDSHIPRILGTCGVLYGVSSLITIIPHFFAHHDLESASTERYLMANTSSRNMGQLCMTETAEDSSASSSNCSEEDKRFAAAKSIAMTLISIGMILQGAAKSPRQPLSQTYLDDNMPKTTSGFYIGIVLCFAVCGPAISYSIGGSISRIYVTLEETDMSPRDPRFIGAWWLGFMVFGIISFVLSLPLFCYPKRMRYNSREVKANKSMIREDTSTTLKTKIAAIKAALLAFKRLSVRPVYMLLVAGTGLRVFSVAGIITFTPKFMQIHYGLSIYKASIIIGFASVGSAAVAIFLSGVLARVLKLELKGMIRISLLTQIISSVIFFMGIFMACPQPQIQDFNINNIQGNAPISSPANSSALCYAGCHCMGAKFFPICGSDGLTYFSPCHAGCSNTTSRGYNDCMCIGTKDSKKSENRSSFDAVPGMCKQECPLYIGFIIIQFLSSFISGLSAVPGTLALIRAVDEKDKSLALGVNSFVASLIGWFLGPIVMGSVIDTTCKLWNTSCSKDGSCAIYDISDVRVKLHAVDGVLSIIYITLTILAYLCIDRFQNSKTNTNPSNSKPI